MIRKDSHSFGFCTNLFSFLIQSCFTCFHTAWTLGFLAKKNFSKFSTSNPTISPFEATLSQNSPFQSTEAAGTGFWGDMKKVSYFLSYDGIKFVRLVIVSYFISNSAVSISWTTILIHLLLSYSNNPKQILHNPFYPNIYESYNLLLLLNTLRVQLQGTQQDYR